MFIYICIHRYAHTHIYIGRERNMHTVSYTYILVYRYLLHVNKYIYTYKYNISIYKQTYPA